MEDPRRRTPRTDAVLAAPGVSEAADRIGRGLVKQHVTAVLERCRLGELPPEEVVEEVLRGLPETATSLRPVLNASGVVVHTNLGRAAWSAAAGEAALTASGWTDVELDLATGRRGPRGAGATSALAARVPAAGGVHVVNNGAAALSLAAVALAAGRRIVVARGELVEIGDGFRIPELLQSLGCELREVGTTNRVRLSDYREALDDSVGFVLKVHPSNFRVEGFTSSVPVGELAALGAPVVADIGSGLLEPHPRLPEEPDATTTLRDGAALVTASGDKLLGGPQCGLLLGERGLVDRLRRHPFARALRVDKVTLAALEATLLGPPTPTATALAARQEELLARAGTIVDRLDLDDAWPEATEGRVGGGGAPGVTLPSAAVSLPATLAEPLRAGTPPVLGRVHGDRLLLDLLALPSHADTALAEAVKRALAHRGTD